MLTPEKNEVNLADFAGVRPDAVSQKVADFRLIFGRQRE
jgi:hypothetical protein